MSSRALVLLLCILPAFGQLKLYEAVEPHMGTLFKIQLYASKPEDANVAFALAFKHIAQLDELFSDYNPSSELNVFCRKAVGKPARITDVLYAVLRESQQLAYRSDGAFDITVGPLTRVWRQARKENRLPTREEIAEAKSRTGYRKLVINPHATEAHLLQREMRLDLGGIAKGYAADQALRLITMRGIFSALIAASGDLVFSGPPPGKKGWTIGLPNGKTLVLANAAVSTSGDSEQHIDANGKRYSHILNPWTGEALTNSTTVTVIAPRGIEADSLATALSVLDEERGRKLLRKGVTAIYSR